MLNRIKRHKFWTSVLILSLVGITLVIAGIVDGLAAGRYVGIYLSVGWVVKMIGFRKEGRP